MVARLVRAGVRRARLPVAPRSVRRVATRSAAALLVAGCGAYMASPYVVLVKLAYAVHINDAATLAQDVDWTRVRQGLKDDIEDHPQVTEVSSRVPDPDALPEFGDSFADTVVASGVDADVTPTHICALMHDTAESMGASAGSATTGVLGALHGAFFTGLDSFEASVNTGTHGKDGLLRVRLERTRGLNWAVTRVWVPPALIAGNQPAQLHRS